MGIHVDVERHGPAGLTVAEVSKVFSDAGQAKVVALLLSNATVKHIGWGSSSTAAAVGDTTLVSANPESRTSGTISNPATNTHRVVGTVEATASRTVAEVGLFDASTAGNLCVRATHTSRSLIAGDQIRYTIDCVFKDSSE